MSLHESYWTVPCFWCGTPAPPEAGVDDSSPDGPLDTTHHCLNPKCGRTFRFTPPDKPAQEAVR